MRKVSTAALAIGFFSFLSIAFFPLLRFSIFLISGEMITLPTLLRGVVFLGGELTIVGLVFFSLKKKESISAIVLLMNTSLFFLVAFYVDLTVLFSLMENGLITTSFSELLYRYIHQEGLWMMLSIGFLCIALCICWYKPIQRANQARLKFSWQVAFWMVLLPLSLSIPLPLFNTLLVWQKPHLLWEPLPWITMTTFNSIAVISLIGCLYVLYQSRITLNIARFSWLKAFQGASIVLGTIFFVNIMSLLWVVMGWHKINTDTAQLNFQRMWSDYSAIGLPLVPLLLSFMGLSVFTLRLKRRLFDETDKAEETSGYFGSAVFLKPKEYSTHHLYEEQERVMMGTDEQKRLLYLPLKNKLTIAPPGVGKTSSSSIPALLSYDGPVFVFDVKGEMWAVTARYRHQVLKRKVVVIDPFGITKGRDFQKGKPKALKKEYRFNPFDWLPDERKERDRVLNNFAASFIVNEGGSVKHFDDNAKILIRGYIDYMMTLPKEERHLSRLYELMSESVEEANNTFAEMGLTEGRSKAAANQISRVGSDERGSILSTSYRQIDWMGDSNLQELLSESNFDLKDFLKGNMDVFVVLPEDQVSEHSRLVRMLMALLQGLIVRANPSDLPKKKMLFLLDELAQLGYCPDVETFIEVLRARGIVVWSVFQDLGQMKLYKKPGLFKGSAIKQIFTNDDTDTMEWIQKLGAKKTVVTKTVSTNKGQSKQVNQMFTTNKSSGEGESVQETGVDLISLNEIREMPIDEQWVFVSGQRPIRCKKIWYVDHPYFAGKFDTNPLEVR